MLDFPAEAVRIGRDIAARYKQRSNSRKSQAAFLYDGHFLEINYGFSESVKTGNCGRFLHEIVKEADCFTMAGALYVVAREAGLRPRLYRAYEMMDVEEGKDPRDCSVGEHEFVTVETGKDEEWMIDPFYHGWGRAKFDGQKHEIEIYDPHHGKLTRRRYARLVQMSEQEYLEQMEKHRAPEGGRLALSATQKIKAAHGTRTYVTFFPESEKLQTSVRYARSLLYEEPYQKCIITDAVAPVTREGEFCFSDGTLSCYYAGMAGWTRHQIPQTPIVFAVRDAEKLWGFWDDLMGASGRKTPAQRMTLGRFVDSLYHAGFQNTLIPRRGSLAADVVRGFEKSIAEVLDARDFAIQSSLEQHAKDEISMKVLLRSAHRVRAEDSVRSVENPWGLVFSDSDRIQFLREGCDGYRKISEGVMRDNVRSMEMRAGLVNGNWYSADRFINSHMERARRAARAFEDAVGLRRLRDRIEFDLSADVALSFRQFDLERQSVEELRAGLGKTDLIRALKSHFFTAIARAYLDRNALALPSYRAGLRRILRKN